MSEIQPEGVPLKEEDIEGGTVLTTAYRPKTKYSWATGIAIGEFLGGLKQGLIIGSKCNHCERVVVPPRIFCEYCFKRTNQWVRLPDTGIVNTYSVSYITTDTTRVKTPTIPAVIEIDGTSHAGFLHIVGEAKPDDVKIGMPVKAVWKEPSSRRGSITDIKYFAPQKR
jgi:uncharacterized OB-fold protein